jgi:hypothetical protein
MHIVAEDRVPSLIFDSDVTAADAGNGNASGQHDKYRSLRPLHGHLLG